MRNWPAYIRRLVGYSTSVLLCAGILRFSDIGCLSKFITGFNCPFCGITRAWLSALSGDFKSAFELNPLFPLVVIVLLVAPVDKNEISRTVWRLCNGLLAAVGIAFGTRWLIF